MSETHPVFQGQLNSGDFFLAAGGKAGYGSVFDLAAFAERIAKK